MLKCFEIMKHIEDYAPLRLTEEWDNAGLQAGDPGQDVKTVLVSLDLNEDIINEAVKKKASLIVTHHPLLFRPLKSVSMDDYRGRLIHMLIRNNISCYAAHTNLDYAAGGTNDALAEEIGLSDIRIIDETYAEPLKKIVTFVPEGEHADRVREAMCRAGAGWIGNYSDCTYMVGGTGTYRPLEGTNPFIGRKGMLEKTAEVRIETIVPQSGVEKVVAEMVKAHPYEEVAYDIYPVENKGAAYGHGRIGKIDPARTLQEFADSLKKKLNVKSVRIIGDADKVKTVATAAGSYDRNLLPYLVGKADILVCGDIKYHDAREIADAGLCAIDVGHYASEIVVVKRLADYIAKTGVEVAVSEVELDPFEYR